MPPTPKPKPTAGAPPGEDQPPRPVVPPGDADEPTQVGVHPETGATVPPHRTRPNENEGRPADAL